MHTGHIVLVEADSPEEAKSIVEGNLMPEEGQSWADWSDWCEIGGRWSDEFGEDNSATLCYDDDPLLADMKIEKFLEYRMNYLESTLKELDEKGFDVEQALKGYDPEKSSLLLGSGDWMSVWRLRTSLDIVDNIWTPYTHVYDMSNGSASLQEFRKRCESAPEKQFLVMVDFHY